MQIKLQLKLITIGSKMVSFGIRFWMQLHNIKIVEFFFPSLRNHKNFNDPLHNAFSTSYGRNCVIVTLWISKAVFANIFLQIFYLLLHSSIIIAPVCIVLPMFARVANRSYVSWSLDTFQFFKRISLIQSPFLNSNRIAKNSAPNGLTKILLLTFSIHKWKTISQNL